VNEERNVRLFLFEANMATVYRGDSKFSRRAALGWNVCEREGEREGV